MSKNFSKRLLAVVATAAICCTMATPMTAKAIETEECNHDIGFEGVTSDLISSAPHSFFYHADLDDDGYAELIVDVCTKEVREYYYVKIFPNCSHEIRITEKGSWIVTIHSEEDNPYHTYEEESE